MNNSVYDEYMRNVLGYEPTYSNTYNNMMYDEYRQMPMQYSNQMDSMQNVMNTQNNMQTMYGFENSGNSELESCYPEIYRIVYPMVQKACEENTRPVTSQLVDTLTKEVYSAIEDESMIQNRGNNEKKQVEKMADTKSENVSEDRQTLVRQTGLNDLIRILILRELLGRPGFPSMRPPRPRPPMRPPFPGPRPPRTMNRVLYNNFNDNYDIYEQQ